MPPQNTNPSGVPLWAPGAAAVLRVAQEVLMSSTLLGVPPDTSLETATHPILPTQNDARAVSERPVGGVVRTGPLAAVR